MNLLLLSVLSPTQHLVSSVSVHERQQLSHETKKVPTRVGLTQHWGHFDSRHFNRRVFPEPLPDKFFSTTFPYFFHRNVTNLKNCTLISPPLEYKLLESSRGSSVPRTV